MKTEYLIKLKLKKTRSQIRKVKTMNRPESVVFLRGFADALSWVLRDKE